MSTTFLSSGTVLFARFNLKLQKGNHGLWKTLQEVCTSVSKRLILDYTQLVCLLFGLRAFTISSWGICLCHCEFFPWENSTLVCSLLEGRVTDICTRWLTLRQRRYWNRGAFQREFAEEIERVVKSLMLFRDSREWAAGWGCVVKITSSDPATSALLCIKTTSPREQEMADDGEKDIKPKPSQPPCTAYIKLLSVYGTRFNKAFSVVGAREGRDHSWRMVSFQP